MRKVQWAAIVWALLGVSLGVVAVVLWPAQPPLRIPGWGWAVAGGYLIVAGVLLFRGLARTRARQFGAANAVTSVRSGLVGVVTGLVAVSFVTPVPPLLLVAIVVPTLVLDGVDGWVARRTASASELGGRFDMEVDAFLLLVLSVSAAVVVGPWVLMIGVMRYAFVLAGAVWPWLNRSLPFRYWRKVVTAVAGIALVLTISGLIPGLGLAAAVLALVLLIESFGRDVIWLVKTRPRQRAASAS